MPGGDNAANEAIPDTEYFAPAVPAILGAAEEVTLIVNKGNQKAAARVLGIARSTLIHKMDKYGISAQEIKSS